MIVGRNIDGRLNLRISSKLKRQVQGYCSAHNTNMSDLVIRFFERIVSNERARRKHERARRKDEKSACQI